MHETGSGPRCFEAARPVHWSRRKTFAESSSKSPQFATPHHQGAIHPAEQNGQLDYGLGANQGPSGVARSGHPFCFSGCSVRAPRSSCSCADSSHPNRHQPPSFLQPAHCLPSEKADGKAVRAVPVAVLLLHICLNHHRPQGVETATRHMHASLTSESNTAACKGLLSRQPPE